MKMELDTVAQLLTDLITNEIMKKIPKTDNDEGIEELSWKYDDMKLQAQGLAEDFKAEGLTYSSLEAEGYLRGILEATNLFYSYFPQNETNA